MSETWKKLVKNLILLGSVILSTMIIIWDVDAMTGSCYHPWVYSTDYTCQTTGSSWPVFYSVLFSGASTATSLDYQGYFHSILVASGNRFDIATRNMYVGNHPYTVYWTDNIWEIWRPSVTSWGDLSWTLSTATWSPSTVNIKWATGATGPEWFQGLSAFEIAMINWFTGNEIEWLESIRWPVGATGAIELSLSGTLFSGSTFQFSQQQEELGTWTTYFNLGQTINWVYYVNWTWVRNLTLILLATVILIAFAIRQGFKSDGKNNPFNV